LERKVAVVEAAQAMLLNAFFAIRALYLTYPFFAN
jgi:hypothetical protein